MLSVSVRPSCPSFCVCGLIQGVDRMIKILGKTAQLKETLAGEARPEWFVVQTHGFSEKLVASELRSRAFVAYAPMRLKRSRDHGNDVVIAEPLFPRYVFAGFSDETPPWTTVLAARGVRSVLMRGQGPAIVAERDLRGIRGVERALYAAFGSHQLGDCPFDAGDEIDVSIGGVPVAAIFSEQVDAKRVAVLLRGLFGRDSRVVIPLSAVMPRGRSPK